MFVLAVYGGDGEAAVGGQEDREKGKKMKRCLPVMLFAVVLASCGTTAEPVTTTAEPVTTTAEPVTQAPETTEGLESTTLRIASSSLPDFTDVNFFRWVQTLEENGITTEAFFFEGDADAFRAVLAGEADIASAGVPPLLHLVAETGEGAKVIANNLQATDYLLISSPDVESLQDLEGRQVGIASPGSLSDTLTRAVLEREGVNLSEVSFVEIGGTSSRVSALLAGQIDAGAAHAADALTAVEEGLKNLHAFGSTIENYLQHGIIATDEWLAQNPNLAQLAVCTYVDSVRWAANNSDDYIALSMTEVEGPSEEVRQQAYDIFQEIDMFAVNGGMDIEQLENTAAIEQEIGALEGEPPPVESWADPRYVEVCLEREGEQ